VQEKKKETRKSRAFNSPYESTRQLVLSGFETPFERELDKRNRWVILSHLIPCDEICGIYLRKVPMSSTGRPAINQPHVRPIVRGKSRSKVEFGSKIHVSVIDGISFLDELSWDAFNEGSRMETYVEMYRKRYSRVL